MTIPVVLGGLFALFAILWYTTKKKDQKRPFAIIAVLALAGAAFTGGYISLATAPATQGPGVPAGQWKATFSAFDDGPAVSTIIVAPDGTHVDVYIAHSSYTATAWNATMNVFNENQATQNTQPYAVQLTYGTVNSVISASTGANYPILGLLSDGKTYNVVWSAVSSAPTPTSISPGVYQASFTSLQNGQEKAVLTVNNPAFGAMTVGQTYEVDLMIGGIALPIYVHPTT